MEETVMKKITLLITALTIMSTIPALGMEQKNQILDFGNLTLVTKGEDNVAVTVTKDGLESAFNKEFVAQLVEESNIDNYRYALVELWNQCKEDHDNNRKQLDSPLSVTFYLQEADNTQRPILQFIRGKLIKRLTGTGSQQVLRKGYTPDRIAADRETIERRLQELKKEVPTKSSPRSPKKKTHTQSTPLQSPTSARNRLKQKVLAKMEQEVVQKGDEVKKKEYELTKTYLKYLEEFITKNSDDIGCETIYVNYKDERIATYDNDAKKLQVIPNQFGLITGIVVALSTDYDNPLDYLTIRSHCNDRLQTKPSNTEDETGISKEEAMELSDKLIDFLRETKEEE